MDEPHERQSAPAPRRHLAGGVLASATGQVALIVANGLLSVAVARIAGTSETGRYGVAITLFAILTPTATIGLKAGIAYLVSRGEWSARRALWESHALALLLTGVVAALVFAVAAIDGGPLEGVGDDVLALTVASVGFGVAWAFSSSILLAEERYEAFGVSQLAQAAVALVLGVSLTFSLDAAGAMIGFASAQALAAAIAAVAVLSGSRSPAAAGTRARLAELRRAVRFGSQTWLSEMFWGLNFRLDVVILNAYVASSAVGVYFVAGSLGAMAWVLPSALQTVLLPRAAALDAAVERGELAGEDSDATVARSLRHAVLLSVPTAAALAVLYLAGVPLLFGSAFVDAIAYGFILMPGVLLAGVGKVAAGVLAGRGRPGYTLLPMLVSTPLTVVLYLLVIPWLEATGAAIVSSVSYGLTAALTVALVRRATGIPYRDLLVPRSGDVGDYRVMVRNLRQYVRDRSRQTARGRDG